MSAEAAKTIINPFARRDQPAQQQDVQAQQQTKVISIIDEAKQIVVKSDADLCIARDFIQRVRALKNQIKDHHGPIIELAYKAHKMAKAKENELVEPLDKAEATVKAAGENYLTEKKQREDEERRAAEEQARKEAQARIAQKKEELDAMLAAAGDESEQIKELQTMINSECSDEDAAIIRAKLTVLQSSAENRAQAAAEAQQELEMAAKVPEILQPVESEKVAGVGKANDIVVEVVDMRLLCAAIGRGEIPPGCVKEVKTPLKALAKAGQKIPGCRVREKVTMRVSNK